MRCEQELERAEGIREEVTNEHDPQEQPLMYGSYLHYEEPIEQGWSE
ncbi:unnamed protein product [Toxocara canis]|uniref:Uncharacterized protein n=1 Tax=Toxocara canis TaxID=6265 RepID=A0A3P7IUY0_TOXCA|nr:unnamed protein product [Toxocara canis]